MKREEEIFKLYNEIDELIDSVSFDDKKKEINKNYENNIPEMPKVYFDKEKKPVEYKEKNEEDKKFIIQLTY